MAEVNQVFICSAPRSGSTFLDMLLGGHSRVASLGEFSFLGKTLALREPCACGDPVGVCAEWAKVFDRISQERGLDLRESPYALWQWDMRSVQVIDHAQQTRGYLLASSLRNLWMNLRETAPDGLRALMPVPASLRRGLHNSLYLYDVIRACWDRQLLIDSSKSLFKALAVYRERPESTRIVLLVRDGRGVLCSRRKSGVSAKKSIEAWVKYYGRAQRLLSRHVAQRDWTIVHYEDLATDTETAVRRLLDFFGLPFEAGLLSLESGVRHVVNGNQGSKDNRRFGVRLDEAWRTDLSAEDLAYFARVAGALNAQLGYQSGH